MNTNEQQYLIAFRNTLAEGTARPVRNGVTTAIFAHQMRFNLQENFPILTTKEVAFEVVKAENLWFLDAGKETGGRLSLAKLNEYLDKPASAKNIWSKDQARFASDGKARFVGDCGLIYGSQWRAWKTSDGKSTDQVASLIKGLQKDPFSRYHIVNSWNPGDISDMCLPPCHMKFQLFVRPRKEKTSKMYLDLSMNQRSCDMFLGVPFNIAGYALLLSMIAQCVDMIPGELVITLEDCHIYLAGLHEDGHMHDYTKGHEEQVKEQLKRVPLPGPMLWLNPEVRDIDAFTMNDIRLLEYSHHGKIKAEML
jgi:thymidylate synthase